MSGVAAEHVELDELEQMYDWLERGGMNVRSLLQQGAMTPREVVGVCRTLQDSPWVDRRLAARAKHRRRKLVRLYLANEERAHARSIARNIARTEDRRRRRHVPADVQLAGTG